MASGKVKWFDNKKGSASSLGKRWDVCSSHIHRGRGLQDVERRETVTFDVITSDKGLKAQNVQRAQA
jgi:cold shock CspA family protein